MRGKVIASGTQINFKEFENVGILCVSVFYEVIMIRGFAKFGPFAWKCVETSLHGIA
jgi:hypothetical protein